MQPALETGCKMRTSNDVVQRWNNTTTSRARNESAFNQATLSSLSFSPRPPGRNFFFLLQVSRSFFPSWKTRWLFPLSKRQGDTSLSLSQNFCWANHNNLCLNLLRGPFARPFTWASLSSLLVDRVLFFLLGRVLLWGATHGGGPIKINVHFHFRLHSTLCRHGWHTLAREIVLGLVAHVCGCDGKSSPSPKQKQEVLHIQK